jgi:hypothetical protein
MSTRCAVRRGYASRMSLDAPSSRAFWVMGALALALGVLCVAAAVATRGWVFVLLAVASAVMVGVAMANVRRITRSRG